MWHFVGMQCVCVHMCMCMCARACVCVHASVCACVCTCVRVRACVCVCLSVCVSVCVYCTYYNMFMLKVSRTGVRVNNFWYIGHFGIPSSLMIRCMAFCLDLVLWKTAIFASESLLVVLKEIGLSSPLSDCGKSTLSTDNVLSFELSSSLPWGCTSVGANSPSSGT